MHACTTERSGLQLEGDFRTVEIRDGKSYWMGRDDLMLLANVAIELNTTILRVKRSSMPIPLFKRMNTRATVRETNDYGAVDCIVVADNT